MATKELLDRETIDQFVLSNLFPTISLFRELVDYGVELLDKCGKIGGSLSDLVITGHFFKHAITMLDSTEIQLSRGAVFAAGVSARSMLEAYMYLEWLLRTDTDMRARYFYVWHLRQKREWARRIIPGTDEFSRYEKRIKSISDMQDLAKRAVLENEARRQDSELLKVLTNKNNKSINDQFDQMKKRPFDVHWYQPTGANSIRDMANKLSLESVYDFFYAQFSDITHVGAFDKHIKFNGKAVIFEPLRSPEGIDTFVGIVASLAFRVYLLIMKKYFPRNLQSFSEKYIKEWRTRFRSVPKVVVKDKNKP